MNPNNTLETARAWLANPENARDRDYQRLASSLVSAEMAIERVADLMGKMGGATTHSSRASTTARSPAASTEDQLAAEILTTAAPLLAQRQAEAKTPTAATDPETAMAASILATAGITPKAHNAAFGASGTDQARQPVTANAAKLEAAALRGFLASPESVSLSDASRREYEQRLSELEG